MVGLGVDFSDAPDYVTHNDLGTAQLLRALHEQGFAGRIVLASSMVVYGEGSYRCEVHGPVRPQRAPSWSPSRPVHFEPTCPACCASLVTPSWSYEDAPLDPRNVYAATKLHQEHLCAAYAAEHGSALLALRYHNVYGPRMPRNTPYAGVASIFRSAAERGEAPLVFEDGGQRRDFIHVADVAAANVLALESESGRHRSAQRGNWRSAHRARDGERSGRRDRIVGHCTPARGRRRLTSGRCPSHHCLTAARRRGPRLSRARGLCRRHAASSLSIPFVPEERTMQLCVIAKEPRPGFAKTRLTPPCTMTQAAAIAEAALADTLDAVLTTPARRRVLALDGAVGSWLPPGFEVVPQSDGGLDQPARRRVRLLHLDHARRAGGADRHGHASGGPGDLDRCRATPEPRRRRRPRTRDRWRLLADRTTNTPYRARSTMSR